jgi:hypothetical protein
VLLQLRRDLPERQLRTGGGAGGHHRQGQRKASARPDDVGDGRALGVDSRPEPAREQRPRFRRAEQIDRHRVRAVGDHQAGQPVPARDHRQTGRARRQQRPDLTGAVGVVEHDQQPAVGDQAAVQAGRLVDAGGDTLRRDAEGDQEPAQRLGRGHRRRVGVESPQVHVQLTVGEPVADPVRPVQRERRLADPRRS